MASTKCPRASIAVSLLRDTAFINLIALGRDGRDAALLFLSLIVAAKDQGNGGVFNCPPITLASLVRWPKWSDVVKALDFLKAHTDWVVHDGNCLTIRSFAKWNPSGGEWGGERPNAGRKKNQDDIQDDNQEGKSRNQDESPPQVGVGIGNGVGGAGGRFGEFWKSWPKHFRKTGRANAEKIWRTQKLDALADAIIAGVHRWRVSQPWCKDDGAYIPLPATWLNGKAWEDDPQPVGEFDRSALEIRPMPVAQAEAIYADLRESGAIA